MRFEEFQASLSMQRAPATISGCLLALWYDGKNDWEAAHNIAQDIHDKNGSLIHAYLHRKEGDEWNAGYWYNKAGRAMPSHSLEREWRELVQEFL